MENAGYAALQVIPTFKGLEGNLEKGTAPILSRAGTRGGSLFGDKAGTSLKSRFVSHAKSAALLAGGILTGATALGIKIGKDAIDEARESQKVGAITTNVIRSTGRAAHVSAKQVGELSTAISNRVGIDDEAIQSGANMILTFKNIRNEAGKSNDVFNQATQITTDMAAAMAGGKGGDIDLKSSAILVGKALNDPTKGLTALTRVGVSFTKQQQDQIKSLVDQGKLMAAQKIILGELKSEFGGTAAAQATMGEKVTVAWKNIEENIGTALLPLIDDVERAFLKKGVPALNKFSDWFADDGIRDIRQFVHGAQPLVESIIPAATTGLQDVAGFLKDAAPYAKKTIDAFNSLPGWAQKSIVLGTAGGLLAKKTGVLSLAKGGGGSLAGQIATTAKPLPVLVTNPGFGAGAPGGGGIPPAAVIGPGATVLSKIPFAVSGAVGAQIAKGILTDIGILHRASKTPFPSDPNALSSSRIGGVQGLKTLSGQTVTVDFGRLSESLQHFGSHSKYAQDLIAELRRLKDVSPEQAGKIGGAIHDIQEAQKIADSLKGNVLRQLIPSVERGVSGVLGPIGKASVGLDLVSRQGSNTFRGLSSDTDKFGHKVEGATTRVDVLEGRLHRFPKRIRTELDLDTTTAERNLATLRAHAGRHMSASLSIELAGRSPQQSALDGVRRR